MWWFCRIKWSDVTGLPSLQRGWIYPVCWRKNKTEFWLSEEDWLSLYKLFYLLLGHRARPHFPPFLLVWCHCVAELQAKECKIYMPLPDPFHDSMQKNLEKEKNLGSHLLKLAMPQNGRSLYFEWALGRELFPGMNCSTPLRSVFLIFNRSLSLH